VLNRDDPRCSRISHGNCKRLDVGSVLGNVLGWRDAIV
jgi:hypothetical protein